MKKEARMLFLSNGGHTIVDWDDYELLARNAWHRRKNGYVERSGHYKVKLMHHVLVPLPGSGLVVDHINRDKTDNRRSNLRLVSPSVNSLNRRIQSNNTSGFRGVSASNGRWVAQIKAPGRKRLIGTFGTKEAAARAYDAEAAKHFGKEAIPNFPHEGEP